MTATGINVSGNGQLNIADSLVNFKGEFAAGNWQGIVETDRTNLSRLVDLGLPLLDVGLALAADSPQTVANLDNLQSKIQNLKSIDGQLSSQFKAAGNVDNLTATGINVSGNGQLNIADSLVNFKGELAAGNWQGIVETDRTNLSRLVDLGLPLLDVGLALAADSPQTVANLDNLQSKIQNLKSIDGQLSSQFKSAGNLDNLTATGINVSGNGKLNIADSLVNFKGEFAAGNWQGIVETDRTNLSRLVDLGLPLLDVGLALAADSPQTVANLDNLQSKIQNLKSIDGQLSSQFKAAGNS